MTQTKRKLVTSRFVITAWLDTQVVIHSLEFLTHVFNTLYLFDLSIVIDRNVGTSNT